MKYNPYYKLSRIEYTKNIGKQALKKRNKFKWIIRINLKKKLKEIKLKKLEKIIREAGSNSQIEQKQKKSCLKKRKKDKNQQFLDLYWKIIKKKNEIKAFLNIYYRIYILYIKI